MDHRQGSANRRGWLVLIAVLSGASTGCDGGDGGDGSSDCTQGQSIACTCTNGSSGAQTCGPDGTYGACTCEGTMIDAAARVKRIFTTRSTYTGDLRTAGAGTSGLDGADRLCALTATAANLGGTWRAWLSDSQTNALDRIDDVGPWYLVDEATRVFNNKANLQTSPIVGLRMDEAGNSEGWGNIIVVWTGTGLGGAKKVYANHDQTWCADWTTTNNCTAAVGPVFGDLEKANQGWTEDTAFNISTSRGHLYCIEQ